MVWVRKRPQVMGDETESEQKIKRLLLGHTARKKNKHDLHSWVLYWALY